MGSKQQAIIKYLRESTPKNLAQLLNLDPTYDELRDTIGFIDIELIECPSVTDSPLPQLSDDFIQYLTVDFKTWLTKNQAHKLFRRDVIQLLEREEWLTLTNVEWMDWDIYYDLVIEAMYDCEDEYYEYYQGQTKDESSAYTAYLYAELIDECEIY